MSVEQDTVVQPWSSVPSFYAGQDVFLTGATGFLGKALVEKLLFSCPDVGRIFVLLRTKRGVPVAQRLEELKKDIVFRRLKSTNAGLLDKLVPIAGNVREIGLSMTEEQVEMIKHVSIVIHSAATVRFDEPLKESIIMNTRGTREMLLLAKRLKNLKIFSYISTAYCNPERMYAEEKIYPVHVEWRDAIRLAETMDIETLDVLAIKYTGFHPNTYTFSKRLAEQMIHEFRNELPVFIHRPSIVSPSLVEPFPGWVDNFNGPVGIMLPVTFGISRVLLGDENCNLSFVPVDLVVNSIIVTTWRMANELAEDKWKSAERVAVFNYGINKKKNVDISQVLYFGLKYVRLYPMEKLFWYPSAIATNSLLLYRFIFLTTQLLPVLTIDLMLKIFGQKLRLIRILRKIALVQVSLQHYLSKQYDFENRNMFQSMQMLNNVDFQTFPCTAEINFNGMMQTAFLGAREYLLKQSPETIPRSRVKYRILQILHFAVVAGLCYYLFMRFMGNCFRVYQQYDLVEI